MGDDNLKLFSPYHDLYIISLESNCESFFFLIF